MVWRRMTFAVMLALIGSACAGTEPRSAASPSEPNAASTTTASTPAQAIPPEPAAPASSAPSSTPAGSASLGVAAAPPASSAKSSSVPSAGGETAAADPDRPRNIRYIVNPGSLQVAVEGMTFVPKAELVKSSKGWTVRIRVEASVRDGAEHTVLAPKGGEVAISGIVHRHDKSGTETFTDQRDGERVVTIKDKPATLSRVWPGPKGPNALSQGDEIELVVGLWGLGSNGLSSRPLKRLCRFRGKIEAGVTRLKVEPPPGVELPQEALP